MRAACRAEQKLTRVFEGRSAGPQPAREPVMVAQQLRQVVSRQASPRGDGLRRPSHDRAGIPPVWKPSGRSCPIVCFDDPRPGEPDHRSGLGPENDVTPAWRTRRIPRRSVGVGEHRTRNGTPRRLQLGNHHRTSWPSAMSEEHNLPASRAPPDAGDENQRRTSCRSRAGSAARSSRRTTDPHRPAHEN